MTRSGSSFMVIQTIFTQSLVWGYMSSLHLLSNCRAWAMGIQEMVFQLRNSLPSFSTCVLLAWVFDTLENIFSSQMRLWQSNCSKFIQFKIISFGSRYFHLMCHMALSSHEFYTKYVKLPSTLDDLPWYLQHSQKLWPFFKQCLDTMDGPIFQLRHLPRTEPGWSREPEPCHWWPQDPDRYD